MKSQNAKFYGLKHASISHEGKCFKNTKISPSSTEEDACIQAASLLLMDKDESTMSNAEGVFAKEIISDGDARDKKNSLTGN